MNEIKEHYPNRFIEFNDDVIMGLMKFYRDAFLSVSEIVVKQKITNELYLIEAKVNGMQESYFITMTARGIEGILSLNPTKQPRISGF